MQNEQSTISINPAPAILWASAFVLAALVIMQAGRLPMNAAHADMTAERGSYTLLTSGTGRGKDVDPYELLYVIDSREQIMLIYEVEDARKKQIILRETYDLNQQFQRAR